VVIVNLDREYRPIGAHRCLGWSHYAEGGGFSLDLIAVTESGRGLNAGAHDHPQATKPVPENTR